MIAAVFSMQGFGQLSAALVAIITLRCFKARIEEDPLNVDYVWRMCLGLGCVPAILGAYYRTKLPETPRFTALVKGDAVRAQKDMERILSPEVASDAAPLIADGYTQPQPTKVSIKDFCAHYNKVKNLKVLVGCAGSWFMLNVAFYGLALNQSTVLLAIGFTSKEQVYNNLYTTAVGNCLINLMGSVPGYWMTVFLVDRLGRKKIQFLGFGVLTVLLALLSIFYEPILDKATWLFIFLYCVGQFFFNFGPNATTFIIPGESFPTRYRSTSHGLCAASGKLGAMVSSFGFTYMISSSDPVPAVRTLLGVLSIFMMGGFLLTFLVEETKGRSLEEISNEVEAFNIQGSRSLRM
eukprot:Phypoly_transcript_11578.p1 GENE.Phypoly_transcript_11578~~Phypoly_transcript_11578.p1  ORF type:complete len:351 (+),score=39.55 Phypoly_transcript_11578:1-1053(+)